MVDGFRGQRLTRSCNRRSKLQNAIVGAVIALIGLGWGDDWRVALALLLGVALLGWIVQRRKCHSSINATQGAQRPLSPPTPSRCRCEAIRLDWVYAGFAGWVDAWLPTDLFGALNCRFASNWARFCNPRIDAESRRLARAEASDPTAGAGIAARIDRGIVAEAPWCRCSRRDSRTSFRGAWGTTRPTPTRRSRSCSTSCGSTEALTKRLA